MNSIRLGDVYFIDNGENGQFDFQGKHKDAIFDIRGRPLTVASPEFRKLLKDLRMNRVRSFPFWTAQHFLWAQQGLQEAAYNGDLIRWEIFKQEAQADAKNLGVLFKDGGTKEVLKRGAVRKFYLNLLAGEEALKIGNIRLAEESQCGAGFIAGMMDQNLEQKLNIELGRYDQWMTGREAILWQSLWELLSKTANDVERLRFIDLPSIKDFEKKCESLGFPPIQLGAIKAIRKVIEHRMRLNDGYLALLEESIDSGSFLKTKFETQMATVKMWASLGNVEKVLSSFNELLQIRNHFSGYDLVKYEYSEISLENFHWQSLGLAYGRAFERARDSAQVAAELGQPEKVEEKIAEANRWAKRAEKGYGGLSGIKEEEAKKLLNRAYQRGVEVSMSKAHWLVQAKLHDDFSQIPFDSTAVQVALDNARFYASTAGIPIDEKKAATILKEADTLGLKDHFLAAERAAKNGRREDCEDHLAIAEDYSRRLKIPFDQKRAEKIRLSFLGQALKDSQWNLSKKERVITL